MATLTSPGVSVTITNESFYATAGTGTVPLVVIATAQDKSQPGSSTALASGTVKSEAGKLNLITSQRDALQKFGTPNFYKVAGTPQYDNELNELGLFSLYEYLGIANQAYVIRADVDLAQLAPSSTEPSGTPSTGSNWLDLNNTTWGLFKSNGNVNSAYSWQSKAPLIPEAINLETIVQGNTTAPIVDPTAAVVTAAGSLVINNVSVALAIGDSITSVINKINNTLALSKKGISATAFVRSQKFYPDGTLVPAVTGRSYGDVYNLRVVANNVETSITLSGTTPSLITDLGFGSTTPTNHHLPKASYGIEGDVAVDTVSIENNARKNGVWQKISQVTVTGTTSWWFKVGSIDANYPGWGWREATPRVITGTIPNPTFTDGQVVNIAIAGSAPFDVTLTGTTLDSFISDLNTAFNDESVNVIAKKNTVGNNSYLQIINYDGTDVWLHDDSDYTGDQHPFLDAGISTSQTFFGSVTGTVSNPTFNVPSLYIGSATTASSGTGYTVGDVLTVQGGTFTTAGQLQVASITAVNVTVQNPGLGYVVGEVITISGAGFTPSSPIQLLVESIGPGGAIDTVSILSPGQYTGGTVPSNPLTGSVAPGSAGVNASFAVTWGVGTVTVSVSTPGLYSAMPSNPVSITGGTGSSATFNLVGAYSFSDVVSIDLGGGTAVEVNVPGTLDGLIAAINAAFPSFTTAGLVVASKVTDSATGGYLLKINNPNGTNFTLKDVSGTALNSAGIPVGYTFGKKLIYKGYSPSLTVPELPADLAIDNIWMNTTAQNRGANFVVKQYRNGTWVNLNINPNTGTIPMYDSTTVADSGFGANKSNGSVFLQYNSDGDTPPEANHVLKVWDEQLSSWQPLSYTPSATEPAGPPASGTYWYNTALQADIMVSTGQVWQGYKVAYPATDPNGPILSASAPTEQSDNTALVDYDIWIDTSDVENYPKIYRYNVANSSWDLIDNTDYTSAAGIIFADARANVNGTATGSTASADMVLSDWVDPDAPLATLYPRGLMMFNTRYSTNNVKKWTPNAVPTAPYKDRWVTISGNKSDGTPYMGHWAQRNVVVQALKAVINANQDARAEQTYFNLIACPGYTEVIGDLVELNTDKKNIGFVIGDTPARLTPDGISVQNWATNANGAISDGPDGLFTHNDYAGLYYPWALSTNLDGSSIFVPPSTMALRTYAYNDQVAYPWFAPAGYTRGLVTGVSAVGYLNSENSFQFVQLSQGQRDVMYTNSINPIAYLPNRGLVVYGQKTTSPTASALDRVNVARLVNYLNYQLDNIAKPFLFEPNDVQTRRAVTTTFTGFIGNLVGLRAIYDFAVVCDDTNNTPERIDRNELWIDIAIKPEKAIEFIYIPVRLLNTGEPLPGANRT